MKYSIAGIIAVREFDAKLHGRDNLNFQGGTLLTNKIEQLKKVEKISSVFVSTESETLADIAREKGAIILKRPCEYASENAIFNDLVKYIANQVEEDVLVWCPVTAPLVNEKDISDAIDLYLNMSDFYDSLITVKQIKRYLLDENGPLNFRHNISERRKDKLPILYEYINAINIAKRMDILEWGYNWGNQPYKLELPQVKAIDICEFEDYQIAKFLSSGEVL
jgi:CMP-N-acetylneuraminic acid synthetase